MLNDYNIIQDLPQQSLTALELIRALHRNPQGFCVLYQKTGGKAVNHGAMRMANDTFPEQLEFSQDTYFTVNSYFRDGRSRQPSTGLYYGLRDEDYLSQLNALYIDFDIGRGDGLVWEDAAIELLKLQRDKMIPPFTMIASSGQGVYAIWLLHDSQTGEGIQATPQNIRRYKELNKALQALMPSWLKPDKTAFDAARLLRISQTLNSRNNAPVQWFAMGNARYTFEGVERFLHRVNYPKLELLPAYEPPPEGFRPIAKRGLYPARRRGFVAVNRQRAHDIEVVEQYRGGFLHGGQKYEDGHVSPGRRCLLSLYCQYLYSVGMHPLEVKAKVRAMASRCNPPYPSDVSDVPLSNVFQGIYATDKDAFFKNQKVKMFHDLLGVPFLPRHLQERLQTVKEDTPAPSKGERVKARQAAIQRVIEQYGHVPPLRKLASMLHTEGITRPDGKPWGKDILKRDLESIK